MSISRDKVRDDILGLLRQLADDWEYTEEITPQTRFFADMGLASLDVVVLGTAVQEHYGQVLPFAEYFVQVGQRGIPDIPVGEWVDFIHTHLNQGPAEQAAREGTSE